MNLLITSAWNCTKEETKEIEKLGYDVIFMQQEKDNLPCDYSWPEVIICNGLFLHHHISRFTSLKLIQTTSAGLDRIPIDYCSEHNIKVNNAKGVYSIPIAEFVISGILDIYKHKKEFYKQQENHEWIKHRELLELNNKNILVLGCGFIGKECAKRLKAFDCNVYGVDIYPFSNQYFDNIYSFDFLNRLLSSADIVIIASPLTNITKELFNKKTFKLMKYNSLLVNVSRGPIVVENDLIDALNNKLSGAVLDVFEEEPLDSNSKLWDMNNVIITPHNCFVGDNNGKRLFKVIFDNLWKQSQKN